MRAQFLLLLSFVFSFSAHAEISGRVHFEEDNFYSSQVEPIDNFQDTLTFELESKNKLSDSIRVLIEPRLVLSTTNNLIDAPLDYNTRDTLIEFKFENFHIQIGSFIKQWEGTDGFNPMDIATVKNYRDPFATESLGSAGINFFGGEKSFTYDAFFVPWQTPVRLPGDHSRWLPRKTPFPLVSGQNSLLVPSEPVIQMQDHEISNDALKNNFGGRIQFHGESWDFSLAAFQGSAQLPILKAHIAGDLVMTLPDGSNVIQIRNPILIQPLEYLRRTFAAGYVSTLSDTWVFRVAGRYDQPVEDHHFGSVDPLLPGPSDQFVGGFEKTLTINSQTVMISLQYSYAKILDPPTGVLNITDPFQNAILYGMRFPIREDFILYFMGLWSHQIGATYNRLRLDKKLADAVTLELGLDLIRGPSDNLLGIWAAESRGSLGLGYQF